MKLLVIDTSGPVCGTAVMDEEKVYSEFTAQNRHTHSASLMPMIERALEAAGMTLGDMDAVAAVTGPGSFTGVRIGVATAKGIAHGAGLPCIAVDALDALSESAGDFDGIVCPIQDARAGQVYGAAFRNGERLIPDAPMKLEEYLDTVSGLGSRFLFTGDGSRRSSGNARRLPRHTGDTFGRPLQEALRSGAGRPPITCTWRRPTCVRRTRRRTKSCWKR